MKTWNHKFPGLPSLSFMHGQLKRFRNQRVRFLLLNPTKYSSIVSKPFLVGKDGSYTQLSSERPIYINGIYTHLFKKCKIDNLNDGWGIVVKPEDMTFQFYFRDVIFEQDGEEYCYPFGKTFGVKPRRANKRKAWSFMMNDIGSCPLVNELRTVGILRRMELHLMVC